MSEEIIGKPAIIEQQPEQAGDVAITYADVSNAKQLLGWKPKIDLRQGLEEYVAWLLEERRQASAAGA